MLVLTAVGVLGALALILATGLVVANRTLYVEEDPRYDAVEAMLPGTNCGACGFPGCRAFAEALVSGDTRPGKCTVSTVDGRDAVAAYLGIDVGAVETRVARLACAGGSNVARRHADYVGNASCRSAALVAGGGKGCFWGCLGFGDCERACDFDAIVMNAHDLPVVLEDKCTACGDCVEICPKDLFSLEDATDRLWVACKNLEFGDGILEDCELGCTACGRCTQDAPDAVSIEDNLAVVHRATADSARQSIERCPTGAILWIAADGSFIRGDAAPAVARRSALPAAPT